MQGIVEKLIGSGLVTLIGMGVVFLGLILLIIVLIMQGKIVKMIGGKPKRPQRQPQAQAAQPVSPVVVQDDRQNQQLVAVIAAALAAYEGDTGKKLVIRSVRRKGGWAETARQEQVYGR